MVKVILVAAILGALVSLLKSTRINDRELQIVSKTAASIGFVVLGVTAWSDGNPIATWLVVGLFLCAIGDVLLLWEHSFDAGLGTFLLGHVAYIVAFHVALPITLWPRLMALPLVLAGLGALVWLWPHLGKRRVSVSAYVAVITVMVWGAFATTLDGRIGWMIAAGAALFYLSDLAVARDRFVAPGFINRLIGLPLYYVGQILIALSV